MTFIDTWGFKAFIDSKESKHKLVKNHIQKIWNHNQPIITTDYIIDETITLLSYKLDYLKLKKFIENLNASIESNFIKMIWVTKNDFEEALKLKLKFKDKLEISFTDMTSIVIIKKLNIKDVITEDDHFNKIGLDLNPLFVD